ncbi:hypothetical protein [Streptomyces sp. NRRL S-474]|uniref:hypothetical protein n=1 Tax=Streptomyces sp. NRRL S-474 TaxID=1463909 RepID=UPI000AC7309A
MLAPGGILDDFMPSTAWPPGSEGAVGELRLFHLGHPALEATEVPTTPSSPAVAAARRG